MKLKKKNKKKKKKLLKKKNPNPPQVLAQVTTEGTNVLEKKEKRT